MPVDVEVTRHTDASWMRPHLERCAGRYHPGLADVAVTAVPTWQSVRPLTRLHGFHIRPVARDRPSLDVVVKVASRRPDSDVGSSVGGRPRLGPVTGGEKPLYEYRTMVAVQSHFERLADPRFVAVRVFDHVADRRAIVLEALTLPTLRELTARTLRRSGHRAFARLEPAYRRAGAWLRAFHDVGWPPDVEVRRADGPSVLGDLVTYASHLQRVGVRNRGLTAVMAAVDAPPTGWFPGSYPLVWNHGDYAGRNLFVDADLRVAAFDPLGRWATPRYEDVAFFLTALRSVRSPLSSRWTLDDVGRVDRLETAFLAGYGAREVLRAGVLRGYRLLLLLDRWCAVRERDASDAQRAATDRSFGRSSARLLAPRPPHDAAAIW